MLAKAALLYSLIKPLRTCLPSIRAVPSTAWLDPGRATRLESCGSPGAASAAPSAPRGRVPRPGPRHRPLVRLARAGFRVPPGQAGDVPGTTSSTWLSNDELPEVARIGLRREVARLMSRRDDPQARQPSIALSQRRPAAPRRSTCFYLWLGDRGGPGRAPPWSCSAQATHGDPRLLATVIGLFTRTVASARPGPSPIFLLRRRPPSGSRCDRPEHYWYAHAALTEATRALALPDPPGRLQADLTGRGGGARSAPRPAGSRVVRVRIAPARTLRERRGADGIGNDGDLADRLPSRTRGQCARGRASRYYTVRAAGAENVA